MAVIVTKVTAVDLADSQPDISAKVLRRPIADANAEASRREDAISWSSQKKVASAGSSTRKELNPEIIDLCRPDSDLSSDLAFYLNKHNIALFSPLSFRLSI